MTRPIFLRRFAPVVGAVALAFAPACGDDGGNGMNEPDAGDDMMEPDSGDTMMEPDGGDDMMEPDGGGDQQTRSGTLAVTEVVEVTNPGGEDIAGSSIAIDFLDTTTGSGEVVTGSTGIGQCAVTVYDVGEDSEPTEVDEGAITISGTNNGDVNDGSFSCGFANGDYVCSMANSSGEELTATDPGGVLGTPQNTNEMEIQVTGADFSGENLVGGFAVFNGFESPNADMNGVAFPITEQNAGTVTVFDQVNFLGANDEATTTDGSYNFLIGVSPFSGNQNADFITGDADEATTVTIEKAAGDTLAGFTVEAEPVGQGLTLAGGENDSQVPYIQPHEFPTAKDEGDVLVSCADSAGDGGDCGPVPVDGDGNPIPAGNLSAIIVSGRTSDGDVSTVEDFELPEPETQYATFRCAFLNQQTATIDQAAINAILDTSPTRIETRVIYANGAFEGDDPNSTRVLAGHTLVGYTNIDQSE